MQNNKKENKESCGLNNKSCLDGTRQAISITTFLLTLMTLTYILTR